MFATELLSLESYLTLRRSIESRRKSDCTPFLSTAELHHDSSSLTAFQSVSPERLSPPNGKEFGSLTASAQAFSPIILEMSRPCLIIIQNCMSENLSSVCRPSLLCVHACMSVTVCVFVSVCICVRECTLFSSLCGCLDTSCEGLAGVSHWEPTQYFSKRDTLCFFKYFALIYAIATFSDFFPPNHPRLWPPRFGFL